VEVDWWADIGWGMYARGFGVEKEETSVREVGGGLEVL